jgi:hypothetical protein
MKQNEGVKGVLVYILLETVEHPAWRECEICVLSQLRCSGSLLRVAKE